MDVSVSNCLSRGLAIVDPYVEAFNSQPFREKAPHAADKNPDSSLFFWRQLKQPGYMPSRHDQSMAFSDRICVEKRNCFPI